ncbi:glycosyltransferase family 2 protein [Klebsiella variicola]|uniref:glycosyltransferase family 2 protein n=1 Tax=Klebsiella variicola TaxID=244366 RepID=UPI000E22A022|nr:glycosyltransferase [Klebsiella variicola]REI61384.1 glycosyltransferase family 2 protein [Klebsiella variicola]
MKFCIVIPTYNGGDLWAETVSSLSKYGPNAADVYIIDSNSSDQTVNLAKSVGFNVKVIDKSSFNHGGTRNEMALSLKDKYDIAIFLTQDAIPEEGFCEAIIASFSDDKVACSYGRQLPHTNANVLAIHARNFNYPAASHCYSMQDANSVGLKTVFTSNSFAAYRLSIFDMIGGVPTRTILSEDMYFAAQAVITGYKVAYVSEARVRHSHNYSVMEEFKRYFDIGVFHCEQPWIRDKFGGAGGEGKKFIISELTYLLKMSPLAIPRACISNMAKISGYKAGQNYKKLPESLVRKFSMHKRYWM